MLGVKLTRTTNCIVFKVINRRSGEKSWQFYVSKDELSLFNGKYFDGDDTLRMFQDGDLSYLQFRFFERREKYDLYIKTDKLIQFLDSKDEHLIIPATLPEISSKLFIEYGSKKLREVLSNRLLRKKFSKAVMRLVDCRHDTIRLTDDWCDYSFYFQKFYKGRYDYNGGLIFHKDYNNPTDISKGYYSIHT